MSVREDCLSALLTLLTGAAGSATVTRNETVPQRIPAAGWIALRDGEATNTTPQMSPLAFHVEHEAQIEVIAAGASREATIGSLIASITAALSANPTLTGAADWTQAGAPTFDDIASSGTMPARSALLPVTLFFLAPGSPAG